MFRTKLPLLAGYVVSPRLVPDWWNPFMREDIGQLAQERLAQIQSANDTTSHASSEPIQLSLYECNALVGTFTSQHNAADLGAVLQYIRGELDEELTPSHMHSLFRVFNHQQDSENVLQLLDVMSSRGETTLETYARALDYLHCMAPLDALVRILRVCQLAQDGFGSHVFHPVQGSELATVAGFGTGPEGEAARADPNSQPGNAEETRRSAPVLSSLLHHLSCTLSTPVAPLLVAVWIRAFGVELSDWDYACILSSVLTYPELYAQLRQTTEMLSEFPMGVVTVDSLLERLEALGWCNDPSSPVALLVAAMRTSLQAANIDTKARIHVGVVNTQCASLEAFVERVLGDAERRAGLGCFQFNTAALYHTVMLLHSTMGNHTQALRLLTRAVLGEELWQLQYGEDRDEGRPLGAASSRNTNSNDSNEEVGEPRRISYLQLIDAGQLLSKVSARTLREVRESFIQLAKRVEVEANEQELLQTSPSLMLSEEQRLSFVPTLASLPKQANTIDALTCVSFTTQFITSKEEAKEVLKRAVSMLNPSKAKVQRTTRHLFKQYAIFCSRHPKPNCKLTENGYAERRKWAAYLDARDTALALFGSADLARDKMKEYFYNDNQLTHLRSSEVIHKDCTDVAKIFFPEFMAAQQQQQGEKNKSPQQWKDLPQWQQTRTSTSHLRCSADPVPRHLWDTDLYNPYPHLYLHQSPLEETPFDDDLFQDLWKVLMNPAVMGNDKWYVRNSDFYILLMRCLLHRLDWEAAALLTAQMLEHSTYTFLIDHELTQIFKEIGDPAGCIAFKVATKLFDGRILRDGQSKRDKFHEDNFS